MRASFSRNCDVPSISALKLIRASLVAILNDFSRSRQFAVLKFMRRCFCEGSDRPERLALQVLHPGEIRVLLEQVAGRPDLVHSGRCHL